MSAEVALVEAAVVTKAGTVDAELIRYCEMFEHAEEATMNARKLSERDRDYYDNKQWTTEEIAELNRRKQPVITVNRIKRKVDLMLGLEQQSRTDPRAWPRNPQDQEASEAATDAIRFVCDSNNFTTTKSRVWKNLHLEGVGGCEVIVEPSEGQPEIKINYYPWDRLFWDPHSVHDDFSDATYLGVVIWQDLDDAVAQAVAAGMDEVLARDVFETTIAGSSWSDTYDDRPRWSIWADPKRKRVRMVLMYHKVLGKWNWCLFTKGGKIAGGASPYTDDKGRSECPLILSSAYVDRDNQRYGVVREMIPVQDEINKRRSKALHLVTMRQARIARTGLDTMEIRQELAKPDGLVTADKDEFEILPTNDMAVSQFNLLTEAKNEIDVMGPNAAMAGKAPKDQSGRAIIAQQQAGLVESADMQDRLRQWSLRVYRAVWNRVKQFWTEETWIRVTDNEQNVKFVGLNQPLTVAQAMVQQAQQQQLQISDQEAAQMAAGQGFDPNGQTGIIRNDVSRMNVDITVDEVPDTVSLEQETWAELVNLGATGQVQLPPQIWIEAAPMRSERKRKIMEQLQGANDPRAAAQAQAQAELQQRGATAEVEKAEADARMAEIGVAEKAVNVQRTQATPLVAQPVPA